MVPALYGQGTIIGMFYTMITGLSILNHGKKHELYPGKTFIVLLDRLIVHFAGVAHLVEYNRLNSLANAKDILLYLRVFLLCTVYAFVNYHIIQNYLKTKYAYTSFLNNALKWLHVTVHIMSCLGGMCILHASFVVGKIEMRTFQC